LKNIFILGAAIAALFVGVVGAASGKRPPTPPGSCTVELTTKSGNLSTAFNALLPGQTLCLHAGVYVRPTAGWDLTASGNFSYPITLQSFPGEVATLDGNNQADVLRVWGSYLNIIGPMVVRNPGESVLGSGPGGIWGKNTSNHVTISQLEVGPTLAGSGIFTESGTSFWTIDRNYIHDLGPVSDRQSHGIYIEGDDQRVSNNLIVHAHYGVGVHVYPVAHRVRVVSNTIDDIWAAGILFGGTDASDIDVVNNIITHVSGNGILAIDCFPTATNYRVHHNLAYFGVYTALTDCTDGGNNLLADPHYENGYHLGTGSPGINTGDGSWLFSPDLDGVVRPQGAGVDKGAYER
jgi:hypothetical protein